MSTAPAPSDVTIEPLADWLYSLSTPVVGVYAVQQSAGFALGGGGPRQGCSPGGMSDVATRPMIPALGGAIVLV